MTINTQKEVKMDIIDSLTLKTLLVLKQKVIWLRKIYIQQRSNN